MKPRDYIPDKDDPLGKRMPREAPTRIIVPLRVGRNDECPCGSGLRYKKCCMNDRAKPWDVN